MTSYDIKYKIGERICSKKLATETAIYGNIPVMHKIHSIRLYADYALYTTTLNGTIQADIRHTEALGTKEVKEYQINALASAIKKLAEKEVPE